MEDLPLVSGGLLVIVGVPGSQAHHLDLCVHVAPSLCAWRCPNFPLL